MIDPLRFYDVGADEWRDATQDDLDRLQRVAIHLGVIRSELRKTPEGLAIMAEAEILVPLKTAR